ncbi:DUF4190 domain-containing protein [Microbacterium sp. LTA6]|uniref:DUF4190 domain-containing protein n=1 Tax=unclassified Microbacterium TaxID=2609290 RepID=UPI003139A653
MTGPRMGADTARRRGEERAPRPQPARSTHIASQTVVPAQTNTLAIVALISGLAGVVFLVPVLGPLVAIAAGYASRRQITARRQGGRRLADAGVVLGWVGLALTCILIGVLVLHQWI